MTQPQYFDGLGDDASRATFSARDALMGWMQDIAPYGVFTTDRDLRIRTWNHWMAVHSGKPADTVIGQLLFDVFPELPHRRLDEHYKRALAGEVSVLSTALHRYLLPFPCRERDAMLPYMLQTVRVAPLPAGDLVLGTVTIIEDVTQREIQSVRLQRQQEYDRMLSSALGTLLQSREPVKEVVALFPKITLPLGFEAYFNYLYDSNTESLLLNAAGGILSRQKESIARLGLGDELCGRCAQLREPLVRERIQQTDDAAAQILRGWGFRSYCCFPLSIESRLVGTLAFASSTRDTISPDELECLSTVAKYFAIAMDRAQRETALHEAQSSLREHAENLETKVAERTARLHDTIAELESFSYTVAHDLRAPIRALKGYCEILLNDYSLPDDSATIVSRLQRASTRLDALTHDLLTFTRLARQQVKLETVDVDEIVQDLVLLMPEIQGGVLHLQSPLPKVRAQRTLVQQCLSNLFDNAVKFAAPERALRITVRSETAVENDAAKDDTRGSPFNSAVLRTMSNHGVAANSNGTGAHAQAARIRICVEDNGVGIPEQAHEKIFGIFERADASDTNTGTGIGLAIVARAMQKMGGACGVRSEPGKGSCFWLEFVVAE